MREVPKVLIKYRDGDVVVLFLEDGCKRGLVGRRVRIRRVDGRFAIRVYDNFWDGLLREGDRRDNIIFTREIEDRRDPECTTVCTC